MSLFYYLNENKRFKVPLSVTKGILSAGPNGIKVIILCNLISPESPYKGNTIRLRLKSLTVLTTHFVINFINYTYSKLVELWPMSLALKNEDSGGTWRKTIMVKKTHVALHT